MHLIHYIKNVTIFIVKNIIFYFSILNFLFANIFTDSAKPININRSSYRTSINANTRTITIESIESFQENIIQGAMIISFSEFEPIINARFTYSDGSKTKWYECKSVNEPYTLRWYSGISKLELVNIIKVEFEVTVSINSEIEIDNIGLFQKMDEKLDSFSSDSLQYSSKYYTEKPVIISRDEWGANPPQSGYSTMPYYNKITLHHAAGFSAETIEEGIAQMQAIQLFHQDVRGWSDIGYHFVIDKAGNIYQGRPETVIGAHTGGSNTGNIGTCVLGCYHPPASDNYFCYDEVTPVTYDSVIKLFAWVSENYNIGGNLLKGHRDYYDFDYTSCPGNNLWSLLPEMRLDIESYKNFGPTPDDYKLYQNFPNPFNNKTEIRFDVIKQENLEIAIYDILGRKIKSIADQDYSPRKDYRVFWDGKNSLNKVVSSGIYLCSIRSKNFKKAIRMVFLK